MLQKPKEILVVCDGSGQGWGDAAVARYAYMIYEGARKVAEGEGEVGSGREMTANVAEYAAVLRAVEALHAGGYEGREVRVRSDSRLVMEQLGMLCVVRSPRLAPWHRAVREAARALEVCYEWVPRAWNQEAHLRAKGER